MGTTQDVKDRIPGLQFKVASSTQGKKTVAGTQHGHIELRCEYTDVALFNAAVGKLNGFKVFGELAEEIVDAISAELDDTDDKLKQSLDTNAQLIAACEEKDKEIARLRGLLQSIEEELSEEAAEAAGEAMFNDTD